MSNKQARKEFGLQLKREKRINDHRAWRKEHLATQGGRCYFCKNPLTFEASILHHTKKLAAGGEDTKSNTVASCKKCNKENS